MNFNNLFTGKDNSTLCMGRVSWGLSFAAICGFGVLIVSTGGAITVLEIAGALSTIAAAHGAAIKIKESTEPT